MKRTIGYIWLVIPTLFSAGMPMTDDTPPSQQATRQTSYTYLALGDSYTIGESVEVSNQWSMQLAQNLTREGKKMETPDIIAKTGWTTAELIKGIDNVALAGKYTIVSLLIGVNNQYRGQSIETYQKEFNTLLHTAINFADGNEAHVFVLSIPDWGVTPYAHDRHSEKIAREIDEFNAAAAEICRKQGVAFIDITPISRTAAKDASMIADDGLHYSGKMYALWANQALPVVKKMLP